jgi:uncharacterized delta-60 repeat protein/uncharacterized repeat protein (TIGR01451 family)
MKYSIVISVAASGLLCGWGAFQTVHAAPGDLDPTFGSGGLVTTDVAGADEEAFLVFVQDNGKILTGGIAAAGANDQVALVRYNADGSLDTGFGTGGKVVTDFSGTGTSSDDPDALFVLGDGKILVPVTTNVAGSNDFGLARYNSDGSLDTNFGTNGLVTTDFSGSGSSDNVRGAVLQENGQVVLGGFTSAGGPSDFALVRYNPDGSLDTGFGSGGKVTTDLSGSDFAEGIALQGDGKIILVGDAGTNDFGLVRYNPDGSLDTSFGTGGKVITDFSGSGSNDFGSDVAIQADGKVVLVGISDAGGTRDLAMVRYNPDGSLDTGFGTAGKVATDIGGGTDDAAENVLIQKDGKIVVIGDSKGVGTSNSFLARYNPDGSLDTGFGAGGLVTRDFSGTGSDDFFFAGAFLPDGRIAVAGSTGNSPAEDFLIARFLGDSSDLSLAKTVDITSVKLGETITYTITATNNGPTGVAGVTVTDPLSTNLTFVSATPSQGACLGTTTVTCDLGTLADAASATITVKVEAASAGTASNTATVSAQATDTDTSNDSASAPDVTIKGGGGCSLVR